MPDQNFTPKQALPKIKHFCAYQERCHSEVKEKLYSYSLSKDDVDVIISQLIEDNFLNEERFAIHFAHGKFSIKHWGRIKIKIELKKKQVSEYCIKIALEKIEEIPYMLTLNKLAAAKLKTLKSEKNKFIRRHQLQYYLRMKGFEGNIINDVIDEMEKAESGI